MEIIDDLEPVKRGPYAGVVGYLDFSGNIDTAIAIRTMVVGDDGRASVQAGAGIVADSVPERRGPRVPQQGAGAPGGRPGRPAHDAPERRRSPVEGSAAMTERHRPARGTEIGPATWSGRGVPTPSTFLQGQLSQDVAALAVGTLVVDLRAPAHRARSTRGRGSPDRRRRAAPRHRPGLGPGAPRPAEAVPHPHQGGARAAGLAGRGRPGADAPTASCPTGCCACRRPARGSRATTCSAPVPSVPAGVGAMSADDLDAPTTSSTACRRWAGS